MLVPKMTESEMVSAMERGRRDVLMFADRVKNKFRRKVLASKQFPVIYKDTFVSADKIRWILLFTATSRKAVSRKGKFSLCYAAVMNTDHGLYVIERTHTDNNERRYNIFPPHFFSRYAERCGIPERGLELISRFIDEVRDFGISTDHKTGKVVGSCSTGVIFGECTALENHIFKTFIRRDMARDESQAKLFEWCEMGRLEIPDFFEGIEENKAALDAKSESPNCITPDKYPPFPSEFSSDSFIAFPSFFEDPPIKISTWTTSKYKSTDSLFPNSNRLRKPSAKKQHGGSERLDERGTCEESLVANG